MRENLHKTRPRQYFFFGVNVFTSPRAKYRLTKSYRNARIVPKNTTPQGGVEGGIAMQADPKKVLRLLKTARGQIDGIIRMVEDDRYCMDISQQLMATAALLNTVNREVLTAHLKGCVASAETQAQREEKIDELVAMLQKILK